MKLWIAQNVRSKAAPLHGRRCWFYEYWTRSKRECSSSSVRALLTRYFFFSTSTNKFLSNEKKLPSPKCKFVFTALSCKFAWLPLAGWIYFNWFVPRRFRGVYLFIVLSPLIWDAPWIAFWNCLFSPAVNYGSLWAVIYEWYPYVRSVFCKTPRHRWSSFELIYRKIQSSTSQSQKLDW